jgi:hypothetical protein
MAQVVEDLPSMSKILGSIQYHEKKKEKKGSEEGKEERGVKGKSKPSNVTIL